MNQDYNSRQRKIYSDYTSYSDESLREIIKRKEDYLPEVIGIINDILSERNVMFSPAGCKGEYDHGVEKNESMYPDREKFFNEERRNKDEVVRSFVEKFNEKSGSELAAIITRYSSYQPETVEAALYVMVNKGIITYDLKEQLLKQIETNINAKNKRARQKKWESSNAFKDYVSGYSDDEIYQMIEDPGGIVIDVYHAILVTAKERQLISEDDFTEYYKVSKEALKTEDDIRREEDRKFLAESESDFVPPGDAELIAEAGKYWKCPSCNEMVEMGLSMCWNCQTGIPETIEHPAKEEILEELKIRQPFNPVKTGLKLIGGGLALGAFVAVFENWGVSDHTHYYRYAICGLAVLLGIFFLIEGLLFKPKEK